MMAVGVEPNDTDLRMKLEQALRAQMTETEETGTDADTPIDGN